MSRLTGNEVANLMEAYSAVYSPQQEEVVENVEQIDEQGTGSTSRPSFRAQQATAQRNVSQRLASGGDIKLRDANPLRQNKPLFNPLSGSALPNQSNRAFGTQLGGRQGVIVKNAVGQGRGFAGAADTVNVAGQTLYKAKRGQDVVYLQGKDKPKLFNKQASAPDSKPDPKPDPGAGDSPPNPKTAPAGVTVKNLAGQSQQVTAGKNYAAVKDGKPVNVSYDASGKRTITPVAPKPEAPAPAAPKPSLKSDIEDTRRMQAASMMRQQGRNMPDGSIPTGDSLKPKPAATPAASTTAFKPSTPALGSSTPQIKTAGTAAAANPTTNQTSTAFKAAPLTTSAATAATTKPDTGITSQQAAVAATSKPVTPNPSATPDKTKPAPKRNEPLWEEQDLFDVILEHLLEEGYAETPEAAIAIMANMGEGWKQEILDEIAPALLAGGVLAAGALGAMAAKNKIDRSNAARANTSPFANQQTKPLPSTPSPFAKPASRTDGGRLTTYGAGGGAAAENSGQTRAQVMQQGAKNLENKKKAPVNQGTDFGR